MRIFSRIFSPFEIIRHARVCMLQAIYRSPFQREMLKEEEGKNFCPPASSFWGDPQPFLLSLSRNGQKGLRFELWPPEFETSFTPGIKRGRSETRERAARVASVSGSADSSHQKPLMMLPPSSNSLDPRHVLLSTHTTSLLLPLYFRWPPAIFMRDFLCVRPKPLSLPGSSLD